MTILAALFCSFKTRSRQCLLMSRNVKILSRKLYLPSLKNVGWIEDAQLILLIVRTFVCSFFPAPPLQIYKQMHGKLEKLIERVLFKLGEYNLLLSILTLRFINCVKFNFGPKSYLPSDSHTNTVISDRFTYPSRWRRKPL